jgi:hypothetical protein
VTSGWPVYTSTVTAVGVASAGTGHDRVSSTSLPTGVSHRGEYVVAVTILDEGPQN